MAKKYVYNRRTGEVIRNNQFPPLAEHEIENLLNAGDRATIELAEAKVEIERLQNELAGVKVKIDDWQDAMSSLSSWLGQGLGDDRTPPIEFETRIRAGVDTLISVETERGKRALAEDIRKCWHSSTPPGMIAALNYIVDQHVPRKVEWSEEKNSNGNTTYLSSCRRFKLFQGIKNDQIVWYISDCGGASDSRSYTLDEAKAAVEESLRSQK